jgi:hypothetical protein
MADYSSIFANAAKGYSGGSPGVTTRPSGGGFMGSGKSYEQYSYDRALQESRNPGSMSYGEIPRAPGQDWNEWMGQQDAFNKTYTGFGIPTARAAATQRDNPSGISGGSVRRSGGGSFGGGGGGAISMGQPAPLDFYLGPAPTLTELNLNYEEMGKRAMEANKPFAEQYRQFAPQTEAGTRALSQAGATMATGQLSRDVAGQVGRGAAALGFSTGLGGRSGIGRNILARDLGLSTLQVQQQGADLLSKSSMLAQQAMQAMAPIGVGEVFGTAANEASINQQIANQNLLNAYQTQALPGQFDIRTGQYVGYQPGSRVTTRPLAPGQRQTPFGIVG